MNKESIQFFTQKIAPIILGTMMIDGIFHLFFTTPFETSDYFQAKALISGSIAYILFRNPLNPPSLIEMTLGALGFMVFFSIWYRIFEVMFGIPFGGRVPTIDLGFVNTSGREVGILSSVIWGLVHWSAFFLSVLLVEKGS